MRRISGFTVMLAALVALLVVFVTILGLSLLPPHSTSTHRNTFSLPEALPTGTMNASNPGGCGANRSDFLSFPAHARLYYYVSVNESDARVNYWILGVSSPPEAGTVTSGNEFGGDIELEAVGATIQFVFQGCGSTSTVPLGFWGNYTLPSAS